MMVKGGQVVSENSDNSSRSNSLSLQKPLVIMIMKYLVKVTY